jgi:uronate dehydrogenase
MADGGRHEYERILITGAAGSLGSRLRTGLAHLAPALRLVDLKPMGEAAAHEEIVACDLSDKEAAFECVRGCDAVVHFAGHPREQTFEEIVTDTLPAAYHVYEASRRFGVKRVVYASSIHAVGFYDVESVPDTAVPHRPDTFYGLTKTFVEDLASLYWDKFGLESVCLRICSCFPEPRDRRMLWSWLSFDDMVRLTEASLTAPRVGFSVIYGTSDNAQAAVSNDRATHIGFWPQDSADDFADGVLARTERPDPKAIATRVVGGGFAATRHPDDEPG